MALYNSFFSLKTIAVFLAFSLYNLSCSGQQSTEDYFRFLDSADTYVDIDTRKTKKFLESIPKPIHQHISGRVAEYYSIKALIHDEYNQQAKFYQSNILALRYAIEEENYCIAGQASLDLHTDKFIVAEDSNDTKYLDQAREYLIKCEDKYAILQIDEMLSYYKSLDGKFKESNTIILNNLSHYRSIKDEEGYYYMFANYMLASNYLQLNNLKNAYKYFNELKRLKQNKTILPYNHRSFMASMYLFFAEFHFDQKQLDSTFHYLKNASQHTKFMAVDALKDYYKLSADSHKQLNNIEASKKFIDSLAVFQDELFYNNINASFDINNNLLESELEIVNQKNKKASIQKFLFLLLGLVMLLSLVYVFFYRKHKMKIETAKCEAKDLNYIKTNNEQLAVKVHGLEVYIKNLKKEVKEISSEKCLEKQKLKIKELYTTLHINSSTILDKSESHLELINDLNIDFFKKIDVLYPQLNKSEVIICCYVLIGFTNKEISVFLNTSIRSVESRRYRISKKIDFDKSNFTLVEHLEKTFKDALHNTILSH